MLTFFCPKCYAENRAEDEICRSCGARLDEEAGDYVDRLIRFSLHHPVPSVAAMAAETLGKIGDRRAVEPLMEILRTSEEPGLLEASAEALGRLRDEEAVPALSKVLERGTVAARRNAVGALGSIGGKEAVAALKEIAARDPSMGVRQYAQNTLGQLATHDRQDSGQTTDKTSIESNEPHKRGISVVLAILDETLCEVEQWASGRETRSVFYKEHNRLSDRQKSEILSEIAQMRTLLQELQETLGLEPTVQDVGSAIRGKCAGLWEHIVELKSKYLRRYGDVPAGLGEYLDPRAEQLIQGILHIMDTLKRRVPEDDRNEPGREPN